MHEGLERVCHAAERNADSYVGGDGLEVRVLRGED